MRNVGVALLLLIGTAVVQATAPAQCGHASGSAVDMSFCQAISAASFWIVREHRETLPQLQHRLEEIKKTLQRLDGQSSDRVSVAESAIPNEPLVFFCPCAAIASARALSERAEQLMLESAARFLPPLRAAFDDTILNRLYRDSIWRQAVIFDLPPTDAACESETGCAPETEFQLKSAILADILSRSTVYTSRLSGIDMRFWTTQKDEGAPYVLSEVQQGDYKLDQLFERAGSLSDQDLLIDVGANIGIITVDVAVHVAQSNATVLSIEAMPFTWLYSVINCWINAPAQMQRGRIVNVLAAIGAANGVPVQLQFRDDSLTSSRAWNPQSENWRTTLLVNLRSSHFESILSEHNLLRLAPRWMKVDCEGCEYHLLSHLSDEYYARVETIVGETHEDIAVHSPDVWATYSPEDRSLAMARWHEKVSP